MNGARVAVAVALALTLGCARRAPKPTTPPPDFRDELTFPTVGSVPFDRSALDRGPSAIIFFATWCMPCLGQLQYFAALQREYADRGFHVVAVGMDLEGRKVLAPFATASELPFPVLVGDQSLIKGETKFGAIKELPAVMLIDRHGKPAAAWTGFAEPNDLRSALDKLLAAD